RNTMATKFAKFVEWATDSRYIPLGSHCSLCDKKLGFFRTGFWSINAGLLAGWCWIMKRALKWETSLLDDTQYWQAMLMAIHKP
ncbi:MAG: hypothetical protein IJE17_10075, partial [Clostridia bacterium]|nr:hypothetical protein [Clostridia bacterium]